MYSRKEGVSEGHSWSQKKKIARKKKVCLTRKKVFQRGSTWTSVKDVDPLPRREIHRFYSREVGGSPETFQKRRIEHKFARPCPRKIY